LDVLSVIVDAQAGVAHLSEITLDVARRVKCPLKQGDGQWQNNKHGDQQDDNPDHIDSCHDPPSCCRTTASIVFTRCWSTCRKPPATAVNPSLSFVTSLGRKLVSCSIARSPRRNFARKLSGLPPIASSVRAICTRYTASTPKKIRT